MAMHIDIARLNLSLHGISAEVVEAAMQGLDAELGRRLGVRRLGQGLSSKTARVDLPELALSPIHLNTALNVAGLRGLIADRLLDAIEMQQQNATAGDL